MKQTIKTYLFLIGIICGVFVGGLTNIQASDFSQERLTKAIEQTIAYEYNTVSNPAYGSVAGEWTMLAIARGDYMDSAYMQKYLSNLKQTLDSCQGVLSSNKYTEYARVILSLSSLRMDASNVFGYSLVAPLGEYDKVTSMGVMSAAFALLALDSRRYDEALLADTGNKTTRDKLITYLIGCEKAQGGFAVSGDVADVDVTAIVLTALAPYKESYPSVSGIIDRGISILSKLQRSGGGYQSYGVPNAESTAQVLVAMATLNISVQDERFQKNGNSVLDALYTFQNEDGSFSHIQGTGANALATDQALYALVALNRRLNGKTNLYDMTDGMDGGNTLHPTMTIQEFLMRCEKIAQNVCIDDENEVNLLTLEYDQQGLFENKEKIKEQLAFAKNQIENLKKETKQLSDDIWNEVDPLRIKQQDKEKIAALKKRFDAISLADQKYVKYADDLKKVSQILEKMEQKRLDQQLFQSMLITNEPFVYEGLDTSKKISYQLTFVMEKQMVSEWNKKDVSVELTTKKEKVGTLPEGAIGFVFSENKVWPYPGKLCVNGLLENGTYTLYRVAGKKAMLAEDEKIARVLVKNQKFTITLSGGGIYYALKEQKQETKEENKNVPIENVNTSKVETNREENKIDIQKKNNPNLGQKSKKRVDNKKNPEKKPSKEDSQNPSVLDADYLRTIMGQDENVSYEQQRGENNPYTYRMVINGMDIKQPKQMNCKLAFTSFADDKIKQIAKDPFVFRFVQYEIPGVVFVQIDCGYRDGEYLLCKYVSADDVSIIKKVQVQDGNLRCTIEEGGIYFITTKLLLGEDVTASSTISEKTWESVDEDTLEVEAGTTTEPEKEETSMRRQGAYYAMLAEMKGELMSILGIIVIGCVTLGLLALRKRMG